MTGHPCLIMTANIGFISNSAVDVRFSTNTFATNHTTLIADSPCGINFSTDLILFPLFLPS